MNKSNDDVLAEVTTLLTHISEVRELNTHLSRSLYHEYSVLYILLPEQVVRYGYVWLHHHDPTLILEESIDCNILKMSDSRCCIVGQIKGNYYSGLREFNLQHEEAVVLGLAIDSRSCYNYDALTREWKKILSYDYRDEEGEENYQYYKRHEGEEWLEMVQEEDKDEFKPLS